VSSDTQAKNSLRQRRVHPHFSEYKALPDERPDNYQPSNHASEARAALKRGKSEALYDLLKRTNGGIYYLAEKDKANSRPWRLNLNANSSQHVLHHLERNNWSVSSSLQKNDDDGFELSGALNDAAAYILHVEMEHGHVNVELRIRYLTPLYYLDSYTLQYE